MTVTAAAVVPSAGTDDGATATVDAAALGTAVNVTSACATSTTPTWAWTVCTPAALALTAPVAVPSSAVTVEGWMKLAVPLDEKVTVSPATGLPYASRTVTVSAICVPSSGADVGEATSDERAGSGAPAVNVTMGWSVSARAPIFAVTVFASAFVDESVPTAAPEPSVADGLEIVFPVPVASNATVAPGTGFPKASRTVAVSAEVPPATSEVGSAATSLVEASGAAGETENVSLVASVRPVLEAVRP